MVFGQDNPAALPSLIKPVFIFSVWGKVIVVDVKCSPGPTERCRYAFLSQRTI